MRYGRQRSDCLVLTTMTPLAPRTPYMAVSVGSVNTWMLAMSYGLMPNNAPFGPGRTAIPSMTYRGSLLPRMVLVPRIRILMLAPDRSTHTPGNRRMRCSSMGSPGLRSISSAVTARSGVASPGVSSGAFSGSGCSVPAPRAHPAHPKRSTATEATATGTRHIAMLEYTPRPTSTFNPARVGPGLTIRERDA